MNSSFSHWICLIPNCHQNWHCCCLVPFLTSQAISPRLLSLLWPPLPALWSLAPLPERQKCKPCAERISAAPDPLGNPNVGGRTLAIMRPSIMTVASLTWAWAQMPDSSLDFICWLLYRKLKLPSPSSWVLSALCNMGCSEVSSTKTADDEVGRVKSWYSLYNLDEPLNLSEPQSSHLSNGMAPGFLMGHLGGKDEVIQVSMQSTEQVVLIVLFPSKGRCGETKTGSPGPPPTSTHSWV